MRAFATIRRPRATAGAVVPVLAAIVAFGIFGQVFLAGLAIFGAGPGWELHAIVGSVLALPILALTALTLRSSGHAHRRAGILLALLYGLQVLLAIAGEDLPWLGALHPANALVLLLVAVSMARHTN